MITCIPLSHEEARSNEEARESQEDSSEAYFYLFGKDNERRSDAIKGSSRLSSGEIKEGWALTVPVSNLFKLQYLRRGIGYFQFKFPSRKSVLKIEIFPDPKTDWMSERTSSSPSESLKAVFFHSLSARGSEFNG